MVKRRSRANLNPKPIHIVGTAQYLYCLCERDEHGIATPGRDCIFEDKEVLFDGPAGTGKTFSDLTFAHWVATTYPNAQILFLRETRKSLTESVLAIFERDVVGLDHEIVRTGGTRSNRTHYEYPNGSRIVLDGTDRIHLQRSAEWDLIIVFEATDPRINLGQWTTLLGRLRGRNVPHPHCMYPDGIMEDGRPVAEGVLEGRFKEREVRGRIVEEGCDDNGTPLYWRRMTAECNPDFVQGEQHWLFQRWKSGVMVRIQGQHGDNPTIDASYLQTLKDMPEPWRTAYYLGGWVAAEGRCWPTYDPRIHLISGEFSKDPTLGLRYVTIQEPTWKDANGYPLRFSVASVVAGFDWGDTHAGSFQVFAVTTAREDGVTRIAFRVAELHAHDRELDWWAERIVTLVDMFGIEAIKYDPAAKTVARHMNTRMGHRGGRLGKSLFEKADNTHATKDWVLGGLDLVRTLFSQNRLFLLRDCHHGPVDSTMALKKRPIGWHEEILGYLWARDKTDAMKVLNHPDKDRGLDDGCLVAGTIVDTERGPLPIESVEVGDRVRTHAGWGQVVESALTGIDREVFEVEIEGGERLVGTGNHPVWTQRGWTDLDSLRYGDMLCAWSSSDVDTCCTGGTTSAGEGSCTEMCGSRFTGRSRKECTSTTSTTIRRTTTPRIWSYSLPPSTRESTGRRSVRRSTRQDSTARDLWLPRGTDPRKVAHGTESTAESAGLGESQLTLSASNAAQLTSPASLGSSALTPASPHLDEPLESTTCVALASCAEESSPSIGTPKQRLVARRVLGVRRVGRSSVYNLTVDRQHTYFASGVLVSNCDAARYALMDIFDRDRQLKPKPMRYDTLDSGHAPIPGAVRAAMAEAQRRPTLGLPSRDNRW